MYVVFTHLYAYNRTVTQYPSVSQLFPLFVFHKQIHCALDSLLIKLSYLKNFEMLFRVTWPLTAAAEVAGFPTGHIISDSHLFQCLTWLIESQMSSGN